MFAGDVTDEEYVVELFKLTVEKFGELSLFGVILSQIGLIEGDIRVYCR